MAKGKKKRREGYGVPPTTVVAQDDRDAVEELPPQPIPRPPSMPIVIPEAKPGNYPLSDEARAAIDEVRALSRHSGRTPRIRPRLIVVSPPDEDSRQARLAQDAQIASMKARHLRKPDARDVVALDAQFGAPAEPPEHSERVEEDAVNR